ncbi:hypothetical protein ACNHKD_14115 [Methylocystis sp. JAN1]|uniref:hypothetical protein n=1 Tax=Methylocystis sp. JAN1 TaxID=3397211 RepID=UPI003FA2AA16
MAKKKSQSSRSASRTARSATRAPARISKGLVLALGVACAGGASFFLGKKGDAPHLNLASLMGSEKSAPASKPAAEPKNAETARTKLADKVGLARLLRGGDDKPAHRAAASKSAEAKDAEPRPPEDIPMPPAKPELARAETRPEARAGFAKPDMPEKQAVAAKPDLPEQPAPLAFALLDREVTQGPDTGERVTLSLNFENLAGKPIRAFEGVMKLTDPQDNNIYSSTISVSALISEGGALHWDQHVDARKLDGRSKRLVSEDKANLRAVFLLKKVFFVDGSVQKYAMPPRAAQAG